MSLNSSTLFSGFTLYTDSELGNDYVNKKANRAAVVAIVVVDRKRVGPSRLIN